MHCRRSHGGSTAKPFPLAAPGAASCGWRPLACETLLTETPTHSRDYRWSRFPHRQPASREERSLLMDYCTFALITGLGEFAQEVALREHIEARPPLLNDTAAPKGGGSSPS